MAGTLDKTTPAPEATPPVPPVEEHVVVPDDASRLCVTCAALLEEGQDWCLECGTAQPGRITPKPGWRAALVVVAVVGLLAAGAVAAGYAALSSDAERQASAAAPPDAQPVVPTPPVQTTPAPVEETPAVPAPENDTESDAPAPSADSDSDAGSSAPGSSAGPSVDTGNDSFDDGDTSGGTSGSGSGGYTEDEGETETEKEKPNPVIALGPDAASTFDPYDRSGGLTGDPADAIDGRLKTAWEAPVGTDDGKVDIGLLVSLDTAKAIDKVRLQAGTPGFTVELYGSKLGTAPDEAPGATRYWQKLDATRDFGTDEKLNAGGEKFRHVLLWFTDQPADTKVMIPEVELRK